MSTPLRLLIVEDNADDALLLLRELRKGGFEPQHERVDTRLAMCQALARQSWDAIIADHSMPHFSAFEALQVMQEHKLDLPFIIVSGTMTEDEVVKALKAGAHDFIFKGRFLRLVPALERALQEACGRRAREAAELAQRTSQEQIKHMSMHDALTDLPNRTLFHEHLRQALNCRRRLRGSVGVHFLDLDEFKRVNDTLGHAAGDELLKMIAQRLRESLRANDIVARFGGDEFGVVQLNVVCPEEAAGLARKICAALRQPMHIDGHEILISVSIGVTLYPEDGDTEEQLLKNADLALYQAKKDGRDTFRFFTADLNARMQDQVTVEHDLRAALDRGEFVLYYQPQIDLNTGAAVGLEALVRWQHPERGLLAPAQFIPAAEDSGLIVPMSAWVLEQACRQHMEWRAAGHEACRIAVNVSPTHIQREDLFAAVKRALQAVHMQPEFLEIEITEGLLLRDKSKAMETLHQLAELGVSIAIDDFGTGYSSLNYLRQLPVNRLKIDQTFVAALNQRTRDHSVIDAIIGLGHKLGMRVLAEGIENERQVACLQELECDEVQGYFYGQPAPPAMLASWLRQAPLTELANSSV